MSENTKIEWCDHTWNPWRGCTKVSAGCAHCYAETLSKRNPTVLGQWGKGRPRVLAKNWAEPVRWNKTWILEHFAPGIGPAGTAIRAFGDRPEDGLRRPRVFPSLCDWLDDEVPITWLERFVALVNDTPHLDWLLLTKRPENWVKRMRQVSWGSPEDSWLHVEPPHNVWLGTSVEDQANADRRIPELIKIPARVRFMSVEPMLGPVDLAYSCFNGSDSFGTMPGLHWIIVGGESGPKARPCNVEWIRSIVRQCAQAKVPCFVKQDSGRFPGMRGRIDDETWSHKEFPCVT